jgi:hypothetical protein
MRLVGEATTTVAVENGGIGDDRERSEGGPRSID